MKRFVFGFIVITSITNISFSQGSNSIDFLEFGIKSSKFIESSFLQNSKYQSELDNPNIEVIGFVASPTGTNYSAILRYGKKVFNNAHLVALLGFSVLNEQVVCFCHICDKISRPSTLVRLNSFSSGLGLRYEVLQIERFNLSFEAIGNYSFLTNESDVEYFGYAISSLIGYQINDSLKFNLKYGREQSFNSYQKKEHFFELGINFGF